jgi:uncharacterized protein YbaP (TraB family)
LGWFRRAVLGAAAILVGLGAAGAAGAAPALWVVRDADSEIYLFGTVHALDPSVRWRTPAYDQAYARADTIWFETDIDRADARTMGAIVARYGVDRDRPLSEKLPATELEALRRQVDLASIDHLRPWAAALMLTMRPVQARGASVESGADLTMTRVARKQAKTIRTFETLEDQARIFSDLPEPVEVQYLADVIRDRIPQRRLSFSRPPSLAEAWAAGDLGRLGPELVGVMRAENPVFYEALLRRRNLAWADTLSRRMHGSSVELVNVGALHMVGAEGLPALMRDRGFTVERVQ